MTRRSLVFSLLLAAGCGSSTESEAPECLAATDCSGADSECSLRTCVNGACGVDLAANGTAIATQVPGDCQLVVCNGAGGTRSAADDTDLPDDGNPCTQDGCSGGVPTSTPTAPRLECGAGLMCDGSGLCVGCLLPSDCPGTDTACRARTCLVGVCGMQDQVDGTACDDGDACTQTDTCQTGACSGANPVSCAAQDQCHVDGTCDSATGACTSPTKSDGVTCDDGLPATTNDTCTAGLCAGVDLCLGVTCTAQDQCHVAGTCDSATGTCSNPNEVDGTACNDGDACTQTDSCQAGACNGANSVICTSSDQCHVAGTCSSTTGICTDPTKSDGAACDDGNPATASDVCTAGVCAGVDLCLGVTCAALDYCHDIGTCNPATGVCSNPNKIDGIACNDGNACTQTDTCQAGACTGANPVFCSPMDQCHDVGTCNPSTGACANPAKADGSACNDGNACTQTDTCQAGACTGANPVFCVASDQCHTAGFCDGATGICSNPQKANGTACNDGDACTQVDTCQAGACNGVNPVVCSATDQCHDVGSCDPTTGVCTDPAAADGKACSYGSPPEIGVCSAGACGP